MGSNLVRTLSSVVERVCVGFVGSCNNDYTTKEFGVPMIRTTNLTGNFVSYQDMKYISLDFHEKNTKSQLKRGDILVARHGDNGLPAIYESDDDANCLNVVIIKPYPNDDLVDNYYLLFALRHPLVIQQIKARVGGSVQGVVNTKDIAELEIPYPSRKTREKIVHHIRCVNNKITLNRQINQTLEQMAQTLFKSWFVDFDPVIDNALDAGNDIPDTLQERAEQRRVLRAKADFKPLPAETRALFPSEFEETELGWMPKGWEYQSFEQSLNNTIGGDWGSEVEDIKHTQKTKIVRGTDIPELISGRESSAPTRWVESKKFASREIKAGDIIIEVSGGSPTQPTGRSIFMSQEIIDRLGGKVVPASFCRRFEPKSIPLGLLASIHLNKIYAEGKTWEYQNQSTGIANFQTKYFLEAEQLLIPNHEVLAQFHELVMPLITKAHNSEQILLVKVRDTLLPKLISGELELDALPEEPELVEAR